MEVIRKDNVSRLVLNNPQKKNALCEKMINSLLSHLRQITGDDSQRAVVIKGANGMFCSGADLEWMKAGARPDINENMQDASLFYQLNATLYNFPKPLIVMVEQFAYGGAMNMENHLSVWKDSRIEHIHIGTGDQVKSSQLLITTN